MYLVLYPGLKLEYFRQQGWEDEWVDNAENILCQEYILHYEGKANPVAATSDSVTDSVSSPQHSGIP